MKTGSRGVDAGHHPPESSELCSGSADFLTRLFGARAAFGVRGVRLISDGIPASMPDGQGQAATFNLDRAERMEVMRGPMSAIYGNHSGGVIQLFAADSEAPPSVETRVAAGSYGTWKTDLATQGRAGELGYVHQNVARTTRQGVEVAVDSR